MCTVLGVSRSGYYKWRNRGESNRKKEEEIIYSAIYYIYKESRSLYGSPRIHNGLIKRGIHCSRNRVARLMRKNGIRSVRSKRYKVTTNSSHKKPISPNMLHSDFRTEKPNKVWVSDITYIDTCEGWLYLTTILDLYNREIVGYSSSNNLYASDTILRALKEAGIRRKISPGLIFHSDRGSQYVSTAFREKLAHYGCLQSMSGRGNCYDNAVAESFFKTLKSELIYQEGKYKTRKEARMSIFEYIECYYNSKRAHSAIEYNTPKEKLELYYKEMKQCA